MFTTAPDLICYNPGVHAQPQPSATVRDYRPTDFETLWKIDQECFTRGISYTRRELELYIRQPRAFTLVAEIEGRTFAFVVADRDRRGRGHIITIDVLPSARRSGLGARLMTLAEDRLRSAGCRLVYLETAVDNTTALAFYKRLGYSVVSTIPRYYLDSVDALVMMKRLDLSTQ